MDTIPTQQIEKPQHVKFAVALMFISILIGFLTNVYELWTASQDPFTHLRIAFAVIILFVLLIITFSLSLGQNWARILITIMVSLGLIFLIPSVTLLAIFSDPLPMFFSLTQTVLQVYAVILLHSKQSRLWFKQPKKS